MSMLYFFSETEHMPPVNQVRNRRLDIDHWNCKRYTYWEEKPENSPA